MEKYFDINENHYSIRCKIYFPKTVRDIRKIVITAHGFGGDKESNSVRKFADRIMTKYKGYGVLCFDWPCHGKDARNRLILAECQEYLDLVIRFVQSHPEIGEIDMYSSSFGAYNTLLYLSRMGNPFRRIVLRCTAVKMYECLVRDFTEEDWKTLEKGHEVIAGYERKIRLSPEFLEEVKANDLMRLDFIDYADDIRMIHGKKDKVASFADAEAFSEQNVIELIPVADGDHMFSNPKSMDFVIQKTIEFLGH